MPNTNMVASSFRALIVLSALVCAAMACGSSVGSNGGTPPGGSGGGNGSSCPQSEGTVGCSCNMDVDGGTGICTDTLASATYQGAAYCNQVASGAACNHPGVASTSACSTTNVIGTCFSSGNNVTAGVRYYSPTYTAATAEAECTSVAGQCFVPSN